MSDATQRFSGGPGAPEAAPMSPAGALRLYVQLLRPAQWTKNLFVFAGLVFAKQLTSAHSVLLVVLAFVCFCLVSSAVYVINDLHDRNEDRLHPVKRTRPLATGAVSAASALLLGVALIVLGLGASLWLDRAFALVTLVYLLLQAAYTFGLKQAVILDVIIIGVGFVLRAIAGAVVIHVPISPWLVLCTFTLCLFLGFSKRRCELNALAQNGSGGDAARHRRTLAEYTPDLLNHMTTLTAGIAVIGYILYAVDQRTTSPVTGFGTNYLIYTLPMVVYAVFRFALLVEHGRVDGPTAVILRDRPFQAAITLWAVAVVVIVYRGVAIHQWLAQVLHRA
jgi:4-hydroxybenzoate polyprenyltransferase